MPAAEKVTEPDGQYATPQDALVARLRATRERRGITLTAVSEATKVATSMFQALERGDLSRWPKGLYRRSFFKGYASAIGLPADSTLQEFLRLFPDDEQPAEQPTAAGCAESAEEPALRLTLGPERRRPSAFWPVSRPTLVDIAIVLLLAMVLVLLTDAGVWTALAVVALSAYPCVASVLRSRAG